MKSFIRFFVSIIILFSLQAFAVQTLICTPSQNSNVQIEIKFEREVNPKSPFIGFLEFQAALYVHHPVSSKSYKDEEIRITPEVYTTDIKLRGDGAFSYLRLYPQFDNANEFTNYTGQLFVNDLNTKTYLNFKNEGNTPGFVCRR